MEPKRTLPQNILQASQLPPTTYMQCFQIRSILINLSRSSLRNFAPQVFIQDFEFPLLTQRISHSNNHHIIKSHETYKQRQQSNSTIIVLILSFGVSILRVYVCEIHQTWYYQHLAGRIWPKIASEYIPVHPDSLGCSIHGPEYFMAILISVYFFTWS